ncbi:MAG: ATP-binding protein [Opitutales bacterium]
MEFINRNEEMRRLMQAAATGGAGLVVLWGRRRLGKSRLLTEWCERTGGLYWVADESGPAMQRQYFAEALAEVFPGFAEVAYSDWRVLLDRLSREARQADWHGPLVVDEFPYLVASAVELPSVVQRWIDQEKRAGGILLAVAGSSQRMMQDHVLDASAPLYGRADQIIKLQPLLPGYIEEALGMASPRVLLDFYTCWGGVPCYWELASPYRETYHKAVDELVLSPMGTLHDEVDRLLRQEMPSAITLRPILDAIGMGAHRSSEIAARLQTPATSLTRGLKQLQDLGYVLREVPFGEDEKRAKKAVYRLADPFLRLWFKTVAAHRSSLRTATAAGRKKRLEHAWPQLQAEAWEDLCRLALPRMELLDREWEPASRHWQGNQSEWDVVSASLDGERLILGECKALLRPAGKTDINRIVRSLMSKTIAPDLDVARRQKEYVIFVPSLRGKPDHLPDCVTLVQGEQVFAALNS